MSVVEMLQKEAQELRITIIEMIHKAQSGHPGGSLSCVEILTVLYEQVMNIKPEEPDWPDRDRFILSKGHAAPALYAVLAKKGYFEHEKLYTLRQLGSFLQGHPSMLALPGVDMSTGSLGMGISVGAGMALAAKLTGKSYRTFVLCGDGELQEGQNWEAMMAISKWNLNNLVTIIDRNHVQLDGSVEQVLPMGNLESKLESFGLDTIACNGHSVKELMDALNTAVKSEKPVAIIAETVKGKGVSFMEGKSLWHGKQIGDDEYVQAINELKGGLV